MEMKNTTNASTTPLFPTFQKRISDATRKLLDDQIAPWAFLSSGKRVQVTRFDGKKITYEGVGFAGSPQLEFWNGYIEPYLEHLVISELSAAVSMAKDRQVDARPLLPEVQELLNTACRRVYQRMSDIDIRQTTREEPEDAFRRPIDHYLQVMSSFIDTIVKSELAMWRQQSKLQKWYSENQFWIWIATGAGTAALAIFKLA
jgi:hypothetical protein